MRFVMRIRTWEFRQLATVHRASKPSRPDKAHRMGYKAKQGFVIYRVRVRRGSSKRPNSKGIVYGKPKTHGIRGLKATRSIRSTAEERAGRRCGNLRVLNSYWAAEDATYKFFEVIMVDPSHPAIRRDPRINWICSGTQKNREGRGLTAAGRKSRGLTVKGSFATRIRPSRRAVTKRRATLSLRRYR